MKRYSARIQSCTNSISSSSSFSCKSRACALVFLHVFNFLAEVMPMSWLQSHFNRRRNTLELVSERSYVNVCASLKDPLSAALKAGDALHAKPGGQLMWLLLMERFI